MAMVMTDETHFPHSQHRSVEAPCMAMGPSPAQTTQANTITTLTVLGR